MTAQREKEQEVTQVCGQRGGLWFLTGSNSWKMKVTHRSKNVCVTAINRMIRNVLKDRIFVPFVTTESLRTVTAHVWI